MTSASNSRPERNVTNVPRITLVLRLLRLGFDAATPHVEARHAILDAMHIAREHGIGFGDLCRAMEEMNGAPRQRPGRPLESPGVSTGAGQPHRSAAANKPMPFGKFRGYPLSAIRRLAPEYLHYVLGKYSKSETALCSTIREVLGLAPSGGASANMTKKQS